MGDQNRREIFGVYIAAFIVMAYVAVGFVNVAIVVFKGQGVVFPSDWTASMLSLASAAFGFLVGKQMTGNQSPVAVTTEGEKPLSVLSVSSDAVIPSGEQAQDDAAGLRVEAKP